MKPSILIALLAFNFCSYGQVKYTTTQYNKLQEVAGTSYVIASVVNWSKVAGSISSERHLLFIDTETGGTTKVEPPNGGYFDQYEQVKIDSLGINQIIVPAKTVDLDNKKGIDWNDPLQIIVLSPDGKTQTQLTDSKLFVQSWTVNKSTGTIVITGHYDTNNNGKKDKKDKNEIGLYDLKTLQLIRKI